MLKMLWGKGEYDYFVSTKSTNMYRILVCMGSPFDNLRSFISLFLFYFMILLPQPSPNHPSREVSIRLLATMAMRAIADC